MNTQCLINEILVAASAAEQNQFVGTQKALLELVILLQELENTEVPLDL
jgi:hypothetical protein